jgi:hypothetical protein
LQNFPLETPQRAFERFPILDANLGQWAIPSLSEERHRADAALGLTRNVQRPAATGSVAPLEFLKRSFYSG